MGLFGELKRRNVLRAALAYLTIGWVVTQVTGTVAPAMNLPAWITPVVIWVGVIGFPFVLLFSWVYELTPEGLKREQEVNRDESVSRLTARRLDTITLAMLALAMALYAFGRWGPHTEQVSVAAPAAPAPAAATPTPASAADATATAPPERSIAVLPFANLSGDPANEYFSDGISEEILNVLARTPELQVAARTSAFAFKGKSEDIAAIARALRVRLVMEGSVRRQGDRVRITAQLIDAAHGYHLWSQTYDRDLKDIFAIQDEIARAIGAELKVRITGIGETGESNRGTTNMAAYDAYLRGMALWQRRREQALWDAVAEHERAIAADPEFAQAYAALALVYAVLGDYTARITPAEAAGRGRDAAERAIARDLLLPEAYAALGNIASTEHRSRTGVDLLRRAIALRPSFATAHQWLGNLLEIQGDMEGAVQSGQRALALDPRSEIIAANLSTQLLMSGRNAEAIAVCEQTLSFAPDSTLCLELVSLGYLVVGDNDAARRSFDRWADVMGRGGPQIAVVFEALAGQTDRRAVAERLAAMSRLDAYDPAGDTVLIDMEISALLVMLGANDLALDWIARQADEVGYVGLGMGLPLMDPIRCDARFRAATQKLQRGDPRAASLCAGNAAQASSP